MPAPLAPLWPLRARVRAAFMAPPVPSPPYAVTAVPVRNEGRRLRRCLEALAAQTLPADAHEAVLLLNNCTDDSLEVALQAQRDLPLRLSIVAVDLAEEHAHVGWARRFAMDMAASRLIETRSDGAVLTTDADSAPQPDWLANNLLALEGADAVAGVIVPDPAEVAALGLNARRRLRLSRRYDRLLVRLRSLIDPEPHDPWPSHGYHCGASIAVRLATYRAVGGLPPVPRSEDRAFFQAVLRRDGRVRHCPNVRVVTSCRLQGRAAGGMADTLAAWREGPGAAVPAVMPLVRRLRLRRLLRLAWQAGAGGRDLADRLGLAPTVLAAALTRPGFGLAWEAAGASSPLLGAAVVRADRIEDEIATARRLIRRYAPTEESGSRRSRSSR